MKNESIKLYIELLDIIMNIAEIKTYAYILKHYADGTKFDISKKIRLDISQTSGLNERSIYNT